MIRIPDQSGIRYFALILLLFLVSCASFSYRFYFLRAASYDGKVIADKPENDIPFSRCQPSEKDQNPCVVMFREEFYRMKGDFQDMRLRLDACERNGGGG